MAILKRNPLKQQEKRLKTARSRERYQRFKGSRLGRLSSRAGRIGTKKDSPYKIGKYRTGRARVLRVIGTAVPISPKTTSKPKGGGRGSRGRPRGSYTYFIPGKGKVDVFTWRRYLAQQNALAKQQLQVQKAQRKVYRQVYSDANSEFQPQQGAQVSQPQFQSQSQSQFSQERYPIPINNPVPQVQPSLKEISILERTPLTMGFENTETFVQRNLATGRPTVRKIGNLL